MSVELDRDKPIRIDEVCRIFGNISKPHLYRLIASGQVPRPFKIGRLSLWFPSECLAALARFAERRNDAVTSGPAR